MQWQCLRYCTWDSSFLCQCMCVAMPFYSVVWPSLLFHPWYGFHYYYNSDNHFNSNIDATLFWCYYFYPQVDSECSGEKVGREVIHVHQDWSYVLTVPQNMWHEARRQEKKLRGLMVDYKKRAERRRNYYELCVSITTTCTHSIINSQSLLPQGIYIYRSWLGCIQVTAYKYKDCP